MIDIQIDTLKLESAIVRFSKAAKGDVRKITRQQAGILVGHMIALTPPGKARGQDMSDSGGIALKAKKEGEAKVESDIRKLFPTSKLPEDALWGMIEAGHEFKVGRGEKLKIRQVASSEADLRRIHSQGRNPRTGRVRTNRGANGAVTRRALLNAYVKSQKKKVGKLNAGWLPAARALRTAKRATPAWITRHTDARGGLNESDSGGRVGIRIFNVQAWFPGDMQERAQRAVFRRQKGLEKALEAILDSNAARATREMAGV